MESCSGAQKHGEQKADGGARLQAKMDAAPVQGNQQSEHDDYEPAA